MNVTFKDNSLRFYGAILLILSISFSPRFYLPVDIPGRIFDLRAEDIVVTVLLCGSFCYLMLKPRIYITPLFLPVLLYLLVIILTTSVNAVHRSANFPRNFFYVSKEIQFFLGFFLISNLIRTKSEMEKIFKFFLIGGGLNLCWVLIQILFEFKSPLFGLDLSYSPLPLVNQRSVIYTASLVGEFSMLSASLYFSFLSYLSYSAYILWPFQDTIHRNLFLGFGILLTAGSIVVGVKVSIVLFLVGVFVLSILRGNAVLLIWAIAIVCFITIFITLMIYIVGDGHSIEGFPIHRVIDWKSYWIGEDRLLVWRLIAPQLIDSFFIGVGKGGSVIINGIEMWYEECHNHYIKIILESGILGLSVFLFLLVRVGLLAVNTFRNSKFLISKIISSSTLCTLLGLCAAAVVQDAFKPVLPNEIFWIFAGLTAATYRIENNQQYRLEDKLTTN